MILWTIQPLEVYQEICDTGVYRCDPVKADLLEYWTLQYDWLAGKMAEKIGPPPKGVRFPVWAWYVYDGKHKKLDLRHMRWKYDTAGLKQVCLELDVPDDQVVLTNFDTWGMILYKIPISYTEEEYNRLGAQCKAMSEEEKAAFLNENWERVFDNTPYHNEWIDRGNMIQATFWELKKEYIRNVRFFTSAAPKPYVLKD